MLPDWLLNALLANSPVLLVLVLYLYHKAEKKRKEDKALNEAIFRLLGDVEIEFRKSGPFVSGLLGGDKGYYFVKGTNKRGYFESYIIVGSDGISQITTTEEKNNHE